MGRRPAPPVALPTWGILDRETLEAIGGFRVGITKHEAIACEIGISKSVEAVGLARVELLTDVRNSASQRVAEKAGFVREGVARAVRAEPRGTARVDMVVWAHVP